MLDLRDLKRQKQAVALREYLLRTDPKAQEQHEASQRIQQQNRERRQANQKAAEALNFSVGDVVQIRLRRDRLDGTKGVVRAIRDQSTGRRMVDVVVTVQRSYGLGPVSQSYPVDAELLRKVSDAETP